MTNKLVILSGSVRRAIGAAAAAVFCVALAGCSTSGVSGFSDPFASPSNAAQRSDPLVEVPLDAATTGVIDQRDEATASDLPVEQSQDLQTADLQQDLQPLELPRQQSQPAALAALTPEAIGEQLGTEPIALAPETVELRNRTEVQLAAISSETDQDSLLVNGYVGVSDPGEQLAMQRAERLYTTIDHGACKGGWGPKPKVINAQKITPGHPYYMEMRLRHTPLLPVGHVYIAYGRMSPEGKPLDEKLVMLAPVGGYVGAGIAGAVPMPGIMKPLYDDCRVKPQAAYRLTLTAERYEKLLLAIKKAKTEKPTYHLFAYNCNHFMSTIASAVGILPPEDIYKPSLVYFYEMMDRNEGRKVPRRASDMSIAQSQLTLSP
ncbi:MAG: hypothetical protein AAF362_05180 [Pseudomonadota bacterium]